MTEKKKRDKPTIEEAVKKINQGVAEKKPKSWTGAPSKYNPAYCDSIIEYMSKGHSLTAWCAENGTYKETAYNWMRENPEFLVAFKTAQSLSQKHWENMLHLTAAGKLKGNLGAQIFWMKNRFRDEWKDRNELELSPSPADQIADGDSEMLKMIPSEDLTKLLEKKDK